MVLKIQRYVKKTNKIEKQKIFLNSCNDITTLWIENANPNSHKVLNAEYFVFKKNKYRVDGKNLILDYSKKEKEVAEWLESTFGGELYMLPKVNNPSVFKQQIICLKMNIGI